MYAQGSEPQQHDDSGKGRFKSLSVREREVVGLAAAGLLDKQIGAQLDISLNTLRTYWARIREKVGDMTRPALVAAYVSDELQATDGVNFNPKLHEGWVMDAKTKMVTATNGINRQHELELGVEHPATAYMAHTHPEDNKKVMEMVMEVADGKRDSVHLIFRMVTSKGVELVNMTVRSTKDEKGEVSKVYGIRVHSLDCREGRNPTVRVCHWEEDDYESEHFHVDEDFAEVFGCPCAGVISRKDISWTRHPEDDARVRKDCQDAISERRDFVVNDIRLLLANGSQVWGRARRRFYYQDDGRVQIIGTFSVFE